MRGGVDDFARSDALVGGEVVHDNDIAERQRRGRELCDTGCEGARVDRPVEEERRGDAFEPPAGDECYRFPVFARVGWKGEIACPWALVRNAGPY